MAFEIEGIEFTKRDFLKNADNILSHPSYWANFVLLGDTSSMCIEVNNHTFLGISREMAFVLCIALVMVLVLMLMTKKGLWNGSR